MLSFDKKLERKPKIRAITAICASAWCVLSAYSVHLRFFRIYVCVCVSVTGTPTSLDCLSPRGIENRQTIAER